jgi:glycosyltransferase involved in cell wall biosynthesis
MSRVVRLAYLVSHPIQYQVPLLRRLSAEPGIALTVLFCSDFSVREYFDDGFGKPVQWDIPLLDGYSSRMLPALRRGTRLSFFSPLNYGLRREFQRGRYDALWVHGWGYWSHWSAVRTAKRLGMKVLLRGETGSHLPPGSAFKRVVRQVLLRRLFRQVDAFLAIGTRNREFYEACGVKVGDIFPVPYAVDNEFFRREARSAAAQREALRASLGLEPGRPVILYASKLAARKRPADLLEAYARLPANAADALPYLLFVGDGDERAALEARANALKHESIRFLGFKNQTELPRYYDLCDLFVLPSRHEPWGLVVNEVMNAGKAVIVSDEVGAAADLVVSGNNGIVFRAGDVDALSQALISVLQDRRYVDMGQRSLEIVSHWGFGEDIAGLRSALAGVELA